MFNQMKTVWLTIALVGCLVGATVPAAGQSKSLSVPDTTGKKGDTLLIPIRVSALVTGDSVYSGQFTYSYNPGVMTIYGIETSGTLTQGIGAFSFNATTRQIAFASSSIMTGSGPLFYLKAAMSLSPSAATDSVRVTNASFNEGTPAITIRNGYFRFLSIAIAPKSPPGTLAVGDSLQFSVSGDQLPPLMWSSSNPTVASINATGMLKCLAVGQITVYVHDSRGLQDSTYLFPVNSALLNSLTLSTHDTSYTQTLAFNLPIYISDVTSLGITSAQYTLTFNGSILQALSVVTAGSMTSSWASPAYNISSGRIDIAAAGSTPLSGSGVLMYVRFRVLPSASGSTATTLSNALFNESIHASLVSRNFSALAAPVVVITPNTAVLTRGDTLTFRVTSGGHSPYTWTSGNPAVASINSSTGFLTALTRGSTTLSVVDSLGFTATSGVISINDLRVSLPDTSVGVADSIDVPVRVEDLTGLGIYSYDLRITYDSTVVRFAQLLNAGTMSSGMNIAVRDTLDTLRVGAASPTMLSGAGTLLKLRFKAAAGTTLSQFSNTNFVYFRFNEAGASTPTATLLNGKITIGVVSVSAPPAPTLLSPANGATGVAINPALTWNASTGATSYTLQVSTVPDFATTIVNQSGIAATSFSVSGLTNNTIYYWRVSATNSGGTSLYSTANSFATIIAAPLAPTLVAPHDTATGVATNPTLSWNASATATSYTVQISANSVFSSFVVNQSGVAGTSYVAGGLSNSTQYYWRVSATNAGGTSPFSTPFSFTTVGGAPAAPTLSSPHDTATAVALSPTLTWNASTGAASYTLQVSTAGDFSALVVNQSDIAGVSSSIGPLTANALYYWRVSATNAGGTSAYSLVFTFTTVAAPPAAPTLVSPHDTATGTALSPTLAWDTSIGATSYRLQVSTSSSFATTVVNDSTLTGLSRQVGPLTGGTTYYWRVNAHNAEGTSAWSSTWSFTTVVSPPPASWNFVSSTGNNCSISVPTAINPSTGTRALQTGDAVGVFFTRNDSLICGGYSLWQDGQDMAITAWGDNAQTTMKDGFASGELIEYKIWDAQAGKELNAVVQYQTGGTTYTSTGTYVLSSLVGVTSIAHSIRLPQGWNMISSFVAPKDSTLDSVFVKIKPNMVIAKNGGGKVYWPALTINTIGKWRSKDGYQLYMQSTDTLTINGDEINPQQVPIIMSSGWSLVSYLRNGPMRSDSAVTTLGSSLVIAKNGGGQVYWPALSINSIGSMKPGQGYQMYLSSGSTLTYPANAASSPPSVLTKTGIVAETQQEMIPEHYKVEKTETGSNATLLVKGIDLKDGDEVGVRGANGKLIGRGVVQSNRAVIAVWGDNGLTEQEKEGAVEGESLALTVWSKSGNKERPVTITSLTDGLTGQMVSNNLQYTTDGVWEVEIGEVKQIPTVFSLEQNYPNPFNPSTVIRYGIPKDVRVRLEVYNLLGQKVMALVDEEQRVGYYEVVFEARSLSSGVYFYILNAGESRQTKKLMVLR